jgi:hypothetical protein
MKNTNLQTLNGFLRYFQQWYPKTKIVLKSQSKLMRLIGFVLNPFNPDFMTGFITTIGNTLYVPDAWMTDAQAKSTMTTIAHEFVHVSDWNANKITYILSYLFPIPLFLIFLGLSIFTPWFLIGALISLFPWPAYWRMRLELHGYTMSLATYYWGGGSLNDQEIEYISGYFTGPAYGFMWPFKTNIIYRLDVVKNNIETGLVLNEPIFQIVQGFYVQNDLIADQLLGTVAMYHKPLV